MINFTYKVVRSFKHKQHGWIKTGRFVKCRPEFAKNYVIRRELVRCSTEGQESVESLWVDILEEPKKVVEKKVVKKTVKKGLKK